MATKNSVSNQAKYFYHACPWNKLMIHKDISDGSICSTCTRKLGKGSIWYINLNNIRPDHWPINYTDMIIKKIKKLLLCPKSFWGLTQFEKIFETFLWIMMGADDLAHEWYVPILWTNLTSHWYFQMKEFENW